MNIQNSQWITVSSDTGDAAPVFRRAFPAAEPVRQALLEITDRVSGDMPEDLPDEERQAMIRELEDRMLAAAGELDFEKAAKLRDELFTLRGDQPMDKPQTRRRRNKNR